MPRGIPPASWLASRAFPKLIPPRSLPAAISIHLASNRIEQLCPTLLHKTIKPVFPVLLEVRRFAVRMECGLVLVLFVDHVNPRILSRSLYKEINASRLPASFFLELAERFDDVFFMPRLNGHMHCQNKHSTSQSYLLLVQKPTSAFFQIEQMLFSPQAPAVSAELAVFVNDPMARDEDRDSIRPVCMTDSALCRRRADALRQFLVGTGLAIGNAEQFVPDAHLKGRTGINEG